MGCVVAIARHLVIAQRRIDRLMAAGGAAEAVRTA
jgi:hypothetical protein